MGPFEPRSRDAKTKEELHDWIVGRVREHSECNDFEATFQIVGKGKLIDTDPTWEPFGRIEMNDTRIGCTDAFKAAVSRAQFLYDLKQ
jgi:hypothetical protein